MAYCINCGKELPDEAKFCSEYGTAVNDASSSTSTQRKTVYDGEIHKCPNCGELLSAFTATCPACGFEIRGVSASHSVVEFAKELKSVELKEHRIYLIRSFPVPITKEDIMEFMILALSNMDVGADGTIMESWLAKIEQCYQKGKLLFQHDVDFAKIQNAYDQAHEKVGNIHQAKKKENIGHILLHTIGL